MVFISNADQVRTTKIAVLLACVHNRIRPNVLTESELMIHPECLNLPIPGVLFAILYTKSTNPVPKVPNNGIQF